MEFPTLLVDVAATEALSAAEAEALADADPDGDKDCKLELVTVSPSAFNIILPASCEDEDMTEDELDELDVDDEFERMLELLSKVELELKLELEESVTNDQHTSHEQFQQTHRMQQKRMTANQQKEQPSSCLSSPFFQAGYAQDVLLPRSKEHSPFNHREAEPALSIWTILSLGLHFWHQQVTALCL